ncbi:unnamed protein product, partial [Parnassius mnemosyne]
MDSNSQIHLNILEGVQMPMIQSTSETVEMMEVGTQQILREDSIVKPLLSTPKKKHRSRLLPKISSLTPNCRRMYKEYRKSRRQLDFRKRTQRALKFSKDQSFLNMTKNMNPLAQKLFWMQIKQANKNIKGRRFSDEEKLIALSILKQSPKCYRFLQKMFILPSKTTLNKVVASLDVTSGINLKIFEALKLEVETWPELRKFCSILFDEVALEAGLTYDKNRDKIHGFVELKDRTNEFADHALVFLLRGAVHKWQQPIAYYFCKGATSAMQMKEIIQQIVEAVGSTGLLPVALCCDQGTAFQAVLKSFQEETRRHQILSGDRTDEAIEISGHKLNIVFDPPHLIKGIRNNFLTKNIKFGDEISKWSDIVDVYKMDCNTIGDTKLLPKLNDEHVMLGKIKKMKVKNCVRVLSHKVAQALNFAANFSHDVHGNKVSQTLRNTASTILLFDNLFDSVNGASTSHKYHKGKNLRKAVTATSEHHTFWQDA